VRRIWFPAGTRLAWGTGVPGLRQLGMATARHPRLKVFQAQFGFHDSVVAAPSQAAALRAWGTRQNLFAEGLARITEDAAAAQAALAHPGVPLRRAVGSKGAFALEPSDMPHIPDAPRPAGLRKTRPDKARPPAAPQRPPADRSALDAAEQALHKLDAARTREEADLRRRQVELDRRVAEAQARYVAAREAATAAVVAARQAYRNAGGTD
jgi:hypothetical protein